MNKNNQSENLPQIPLKVSRWYYVLIFVLIILSFITLNRNIKGEWAISLSIGEITTPILIALLFLPTLLNFFKAYEQGGVKLPGFEVSWARKKEVDAELSKIEQKHSEAGNVAKNHKEDFKQVETIQRSADSELINAIDPEELPIFKQIYLQELNELVKNFNRNRHLRLGGKSTTNQGDDIAFRMRSISPLLFGEFEVEKWLSSSNPGKRLAAIKYLDWAQDIEFLEPLLDRLLEEGAFIQYHVWLTLFSLKDQLTPEQAGPVRKKIGRLYST